MYIVYTDGSCSKNIGGYGFIVLKDDVIILQDYGHIPQCTNQIAELTAIKMALLCIRNSICNTEDIENVIIRSDSRYSIDCLTTWMPNWKKNGYKTANNKPIKNKELILECYTLLNTLLQPSIQFEHVYGHKGDKYNEMADRLANQGRMEIGG